MTGDGLYQCRFCDTEVADADPSEPCPSCEKRGWYLATDGGEGLYQKYAVEKDGEPVEDCFVLEPEDDPAAQRALKAYAKATGDEALASDLREQYDLMRTPEEARIQKLEERMRDMVYVDDLHDLADDWRDQGTGNVDWNDYNDGLHGALRACADELEEVLEER